MDLGCGYGDIVDEVIRTYGPQIPKDARIIAADTSPGMIELVRKRQTKDSTWAKVEPTVCNAMELSTHADNSLSHIMSGFTIFILPDPRKGLAEALRVLQPGGVFAYSIMAETAWSSVFLKFLEVRPEIRLPQVGAPVSTSSSILLRFWL